MEIILVSGRMEGLWRQEPCPQAGVVAAVHGLLAVLSPDGAGPSDATPGPLVVPQSNEPASCSPNNFLFVQMLCFS